jgi:DNA-binding GntR family transcriptional regulator
MAAFVPDYQRIADDIIAQIKDGRLPPGTKLPTRRELGERYGVSAQAIDSAMLVLRTGGWVRGHQGRGSFVTDNPPI